MKLDNVCIELELSPTVLNLLQVLSETDDVREVIYSLIDHAQRGVYRPGAWEREWIMRAFGDQWVDKLEWGDPHGRAEELDRIFQRPVKRRTA